MEIRDILLFAKAGEPCGAQSALAARLADRFSARLAGVCLYSDPDLPFADDYAIGPAAIDMVLADRNRKIDEMVTPIEVEFRKAASAHGLSADWGVFGPDEPSALSALRAQFCDLAIARRPVREGESAELAATLALASGAPCLIVPDGADPARDFERILVAWDGSPTAKHALDNALPFLKQASAVEVVVIDGDGLSAADENWAAKLLNHLEHHGIGVEIRHASKTAHSVGQALLAACADFDADLLVMGAYGHSRMVEALAGGVTRTVLSHAPIPVLMAH